MVSFCSLLIESEAELRVGAMLNVSCKNNCIYLGGKEGGLGTREHEEVEIALIRTLEGRFDPGYVASGF